MIDTACRLCKPVQSWSFAFMYDVGWSLRRAWGVAGYAERKIPSGENQNRYLMLFDDRHGFPALQAGAKLELCC
jgi:hypothetical protein